MVFIYHFEEKRTGRLKKVRNCRMSPIFFENHTNRKGKFPFSRRTRKASS